MLQLIIPMLQSLIAVICSDHPYFVGVQFHPEFLTRPHKPSPPYLGLVLAASGKLTSYLSRGCRMSPSNSLGNLFGEKEKLTY